jgi:hypothetical protein
MNSTIASPADDHKDRDTTNELAAASLQREAQPGSTDEPVPNLDLSESQPDDAVELPGNARTTSSAVKLSVTPNPTVPAKAPATQPSSPPTKPPKPPEIGTQADEPLPELPSSKPGKINLDKFRLSQDIVEHGGGKKLLTVVPVRRPSKEAWFRAHPDLNFRVKVKVIELKDIREVYLVTPDLWLDLDGESTFVPKLLVPVITRQLALSIWPIRLPGPDGRIDEWNTSALEAAKIAVSKWVRLSPNMSLGAYDVMVGPDPQPEVVWPEYSFDEIINIAFRDKYIDSLDHPVIRQLRP